MKKSYFFILSVFSTLYMLFKAHHDKIKDQTVVDSKLPNELNGFRIFYITDIHRRRIRVKTLRSITKQIDLVIIGGDLTEKYVPLTRTRKNLQLLNRWNVPVCFVWGNNDLEIPKHKLIHLLEEEKVQILSDDQLEIQRGNRTLHVIGLDYLSPEDKRYFILKQTKDDYSIVLTHIPLLYKELNEFERDNINLVFSAHTHGGQIRIADLGLYERGSIETFGSTSIIISEGYGYSVLPFRLGTNAECHVITLRNE